MGTSATTPWHIWEHNVIDAALKAGAELEGIKAHRNRLHAAYAAGEPIWMMVDELVIRATDYTLRKAVREEPIRLRNFLRSCIKD